MAHALVKEEFAPLNVKRVHRIWKEERLGRIKRYRKNRTGSSVPLAAEGPNQVWCVDFCFDWAENRTRLKVLTIKDEFTKELLALEVAPRYRSSQMQEALSRLFKARGAPAYLRSDNGSEFISQGSPGRTATPSHSFLGFGRKCSTSRCFSTWPTPDGKVAK